jgi:hypothetical protein
MDGAIRTISNDQKGNMKTFHWIGILTVGVLCLGASRSMAQTSDVTGTAITNEGTFQNVVLNSTYAFSVTGVDLPNGGNFSLDGTTISNLGSLNPAVALQLTLTSITYTEGSVTGNGETPSITFDLTPTPGNANLPTGGLPSIQVTLYASGPIASGVTENDVVFSLANPGSVPNPVVWAPVAEENPGNGSEGTGGQWTESLANLEPHPDSITTSGAENFNPSSVQNDDFTFAGSLEVIYATPEPQSFWLALVAGLGFGALFATRRRSAKSA